MPVTDEQLRTSLGAARDALVLEGDTDLAAPLLRQRAAVAPARRRRRWPWAVGIAIGVLGTGATATAALVGNDGSHAAFRHLHPLKADAGASTEQPHALLGTLPLEHGVRLRAWVTTRPGRNACVLVSQLTDAGDATDSIAYCGEDPATAADVRLVNGAQIGWVPSTDARSVLVVAAGYRASARTVSQHFIVPPAPAGTAETVTALDAAGRPLQAWPVTVG